MPWQLFALISALALSGESIIEKGEIHKENPNRFAAIVAVLSGLVVVPFMWLVPWQSFSLMTWGWLFLCAVVTVGGFFCTVQAIHVMQISRSAPMFTLTPAVGALLAAALIGESLHSSQIWGIVLLVFGGYVVQLKKEEGWLYPIQTVLHSRDMHFLLAAIVLYPLGNVMARYSFSNFHVTPYEYLVALKLIGGAGFAAYLHYGLGGLRTISRDIGKHKGGFFWITLLSTINSSGVVLALGTAPVALVQAVKRLSSLITTVVGGGMYHEDNILRKSIGCAVMLTGTLIVVLT